MSPVLQVPVPLPIAGWTCSDVDASTQPAGSHLPYAQAEKFFFPEGQDDILICIAGRHGRGRSLQGDLALNASSLW